MQSKLLRTGLITAVLAVTPTYLAAQAAPAAPATAPAAASEAEQIQQRLALVQQQAMQDSAVHASAAAVTSAMEAADPEYKALSARAQQLRTDIAAAQASQDNAKLNELAAVAGKLQTEAAALQARVASNPAVQEKTNAYRTVVFQKMMEIDPETQALIAKLAQLRG